MAPPDDQPLFVAPEPPQDDIRLTAKEWSILSLVNGKRTIRQIIEATARPEEDVRSVLAGLLTADLVLKERDSAYLDRLHHYIPGWEVDIIRGEMFSDGYGFVVDYIAEVLKSMRSQDYSDRFQAHFTLSPDISTRDRDGIHKTFSGLMKILYPGGEATREETEEILRFAICLLYTSPSPRD